MKKRIIIEEKNNPKAPVKTPFNRIVKNKFFEWLLYMIGYAIVLIIVSSLFTKSLYINNKYFGLYALLASIIIYILNQTIKPILVYITLPLTALTYGLFYPITNVVILYITSFILGNNFQIHGIIISFLIAIIISFLNLLMEGMIIKPIINKGKWCDKMDRILITIGPFTIYWYSFLILVAVLIGCNIAIKYSQRLNMPSTIVSDMILGLILSAIIGARIYYVLFNLEAYQNLIDIFKIWEGGLAIYGAIIAGTIYIFNYCKKRQISFIKMLDVCSLSLLLGQAIGRWGNFFNSEAYGGITTYEQLQSQHIPAFIINGMYIEGAYRVPTFLYESIWCLIGVIILHFIRKRNSNKTGKQISFYLIWYGIGRLFIEQMRTDSLYIGTFRVSQIVSVIIIIIGLIVSLIIYKNNHKKLSNKVEGVQDGRI